MDQNKTEALKNKTKEERRQFFDLCNTDNLSDAATYSANGGALATEKKNPDSEECPFEGNWDSSFGYVCDGEVVC